MSPALPGRITAWRAGTPRRGLAGDRSVGKSVDLGDPCADRHGELELVAAMGVRVRWTNDVPDRRSLLASRAEPEESFEERCELGEHTPLLLAVGGVGGEA